MASSNRLELIIAADASQFQNAVRQAQSEAQGLQGGLQAMGGSATQSAGSVTQLAADVAALTAVTQAMGESIGSAIVRHQQAAEAAREQAAAEAAAAAAAAAAKNRYSAAEIKKSESGHIVEETDLMDGLAAARAKAAQEAANHEAATKRESAAMAESKQPLQLGAVHLAALAGGAAMLTRSFLEASARMEQYRATLQTLSKSSEEAEGHLQRMVKFAGSTPFEMAGVVEAGVKLKSLGLDIDRVLPLAGDMASVFGKDITDGANALGKAMAGSQDGIQQLADSFGISRQKMIQYGAAAEGAGEVSVRTAGDVAKLRGALEAIVKTEYGGAMKRQMDTLAGQFSNLQDSITQLMTSVGNAMGPTAKVVMSGLTGMFESLNSLGPVIKGVTGGFIALVPAVIGLVGAMKALGTFSTATTSVGAFGAALGSLLPALAAVAAGLVLISATNREQASALAENRQMAEDLGKQYEKLGQANLDGWATANAEALHRQGVSVKDLIDAQQALADKIGRINADESLSADQKKALIDALVKQKDQLHQNSAALSDYEKKLAASNVANENAAKFIEDSRKAYVGLMQTQAALAQEDIRTTNLRLRNEELLGQGAVDIQKTVAQATTDAALGRVSAQQAVSDATIAAAQRERDAVLASIQDQMIARAGAMTPEETINFGKQREAAEKKYSNTVKEEAQKQVDIERQAQQRRLEAVQARVAEAIAAEDRYLHALERVRRYGTDTSEEEAASSKRRMMSEKEAEAKRYSLDWGNAKTDSERAKVNAEHRTREAEIESAHQQRLEGIDDRKAQRKADRARLAAETTQIELDNTDQEIQALERRREKGEAVETALAAQYQKRRDLRVRLAKENADASSATELDPDKQKLIEKRRQAEVSKADTEYGNAREKAHDDEMKRQADQYESQARNLKARIDGLNQEIELAKRNGDAQQKINDLIEQRNRLIREKAGVDSQAASAKASTSNETATDRAATEQENTNRRRQANMDTNNTSGRSGGARISVDANGNRVLVKDDSTSGGGMKVGTDANGNRVLTKDDESGAGSGPSTTGSPPPLASSPPSAAPAASSSASSGAGGGGGTLTAGNITIHAQSVTVNGSGGTASSTSSTSTPQQGEQSVMQPAPRASMGTSFVGDFMGGLNSSALKRDAFFAGGS